MKKKSNSKNENNAFLLSTMINKYHIQKKNKLKC